MPQSMNMPTAAPVVIGRGNQNPHQYAGLPLARAFAAGRSTARHHHRYRIARRGGACGTTETLALEPIPSVSPSEIIGLLEYLDARGGREDVFSNRL